MWKKPSSVKLCTQWNSNIQNEKKKDTLSTRGGFKDEWNIIEGVVSYYFCIQLNTEIYRGDCDSAFYSSRKGKNFKVDLANLSQYLQAFNPTEVCASLHDGHLSFSSSQLTGTAPLQWFSPTRPSPPSHVAECLMCLPHCLVVAPSSKTQLSTAFCIDNSPGHGRTGLKKLIYTGAIFYHFKTVQVLKW